MTCRGCGATIVARCCEQCTLELVADADDFDADELGIDPEDDYDA